MQAKIPYVPLLVADGSAEENIRAWWLLRTFLVRSFGILQSHLTISLSMMILVSTPPGVALLPVLAECAGATGCAPRELRNDTRAHALSDNRLGFVSCSAGALGLCGGLRHSRSAAV